MSYAAPLADLMLAQEATGCLAPDAPLTGADIEAILTEAGRFAAGVLVPLGRVGDTHSARFDPATGRVTTPPGWADAYRAWCAAGWSSVNGPEAYGGQDLPVPVSLACAELWNAASLAFGVGPLLTNGAIEAIAAHAAPALKDAYLPQLVAGTWTGTMNLTEPQAGSDLSGLRCRAARAGDGTYRITGTKIYITYGEHDCADNIVHLVLARLADAPEGTRGISLFLVPKILPDGSRNDLRCGGIEHKLGLHGSPTCTMIYGDGGGATGWLVGEENRGLACMFTMMNTARLLVGMQGVGVAERATQKARAYAAERRQGRAPGAVTGPSPILDHPDVRRMLTEMAGRTQAARLLCMATAAAMETERHAASGPARTAAAARAALLTPLAKAYATDTAVEVASMGVQIHGGMGYVEETGAAQLLRDARILPIYEGTNGIQAIDFLTRKVAADDGAALASLLSEVASMIDAAADIPALAGMSATLGAALSGLQADLPRLRALPPDRALGVASYLLAAVSTLVGGAYLCHAAALARGRPGDADRVATAAHFAATSTTAEAARLHAALALA